MLIGGYEYRDGALWLPKKKLDIRLVIKCLIVVLFLFTLLIPREVTPAIHHETTPVVVQKSKLAEYITSVNSTIEEDKAIEISNAIFKHAPTFNIDPRMLAAVIQVESRFNQFAISSTGALGLVQLVPYWHLEKLKYAISEFGSPEIFDISNNIYFGAWVLSECKRKHDSIERALKCYNGKSDKDYAKKVIAARKEISL